MICPICKFEMSHSDMGLASHMRKHVKSGEVTKAQVLEIRKAKGIPSGFQWVEKDVQLEKKLTESTGIS